MFKFLKELFKSRVKYLKGNPGKITIINDKRGNQIYYYNNGYEEWREWDENNNLIHFKNSEGVEYFCEYDEDGNIIHFKDEKGYEFYDEYDKHHNLISHRRVEK